MGVVHERLGAVHQVAEADRLSGQARRPVWAACCGKLEWTDAGGVLSIVAPRAQEASVRAADAVPVAAGHRLVQPHPPPRCPQAAGQQGGDMAFADVRVSTEDGEAQLITSERSYSLGAW